MKENIDNLAEFLIAIFQIPVFVGVALSYLSVNWYKTQVNDVFSEIENVINQRITKFKNESYERSVKLADIFLKYPIVFLCNVFTTNASIQMLVRGKIAPDDWYLPFHFR